MEKTRYYVSVQADTVLTDQGAAAYEFEIEATPKEIDKLQELFEEKNDAADATFFRAHYPAVPYHYDQENDRYDGNLKEIYKMIYDLGTQETKRHIESMGILQ